MKLAPLAFLLLAGCSEDVNVHVHCITTAAPAVECELKQTKGKSEVEVCWEFVATCGNGAVVKAARTCETVKEGGTVKSTITRDKLDGVDQCAGDKAPTAKVENLTLNGKARKLD